MNPFYAFYRSHLSAGFQLAASQGFAGSSPPESERQPTRGLIVAHARLVTRHELLLES
jgi:hypothetical protein